MVGTQDDARPNGHRMEIEALEYLKAKKVDVLKCSAIRSTPYLRDPSLRIPSRTEGRSMGPSLIRPRQEMIVVQPMVYRCAAPANTSSNPVLKEYRKEFMPIEGQLRALWINWPTPFSARIMEAPTFPKVKLLTIELFDGRTN